MGKQKYQFSLTSGWKIKINYSLCNVVECRLSCDENNSKSRLIRNRRRELTWKNISFSVITHFRLEKRNETAYYVDGHSYMVKISSRLRVSFLRLSRRSVFESTDINILGYSELPELGVDQR